MVTILAVTQGFHPVTPAWGTVASSGVWALYYTVATWTSLSNGWPPGFLLYHSAPGSSLLLSLLRKETAPGSDHIQVSDMKMSLCLNYMKISWDCGFQTLPTPPPQTWVRVLRLELWVPVVTQGNNWKKGYNHWGPQRSGSSLRSLNFIIKKSVQSTVWVLVLFLCLWFRLKVWNLPLIGTKMGIH